MFSVRLIRVRKRSGAHLAEVCEAVVLRHGARLVRVTAVRPAVQSV